jgi:hypothetical protein
VFHGSAGPGRGSSDSAAVVRRGNRTRFSSSSNIRLPLGLHPNITVAINSCRNHDG